MTLWFKAHVLFALVILIADARGTLEPTVKKIEQKLGIPVYYEEVSDSTNQISNPYPIQYAPHLDTINSHRENK